MQAKLFKVIIFFKEKNPLADQTRQAKSFLQPVNLSVPLITKLLILASTLFHLLGRKVCVFTQEKVCGGYYRLEAWLMPLSLSAKST